MKNKSFYILPVYNKESLISRVLQGILDSHSNDTPVIVCILDACTDNSESILKSFMNQADIHTLYQSDVHEIKCINTGLEYIRDNLSPEPNDLIFCLQDDVILDEKDIDVKFDDLFILNPNLGYVTMRIGTSLTSNGSEIIEQGLLESEFGAWNQLGWTFHESIPYNTLRHVEIAVRSPTCMLWKRFEEVGFFDENLCPAGYDCHDMSIRLNQKGYQNAMYIMKYISEVNWGTMRSEENIPNQPYIDSVYSRNRQYLANKHRDYFNAKI
jgi:glycosyltransferase involved in cell wall biosynthesis